MFASLAKQLGIENLADYEGENPFKKKNKKKRQEQGKFVKGG